MNTPSLSPCIGCAAQGACGLQGGAQARPGSPGSPLLAGLRDPSDLSLPSAPSPRGLLCLSVLCFGLPLTLFVAVLPRLDEAGAGIQLLAVLAVLFVVVLLVRAVPEHRYRQLLRAAAADR